MTNLTKQPTQTSQKRHWLAGGVIAVALLSVAAVQADAQATLAAPNTEAAYTPVGLGNASNEPSPQSATFMLASLPATPARAQASTPMPRFDLNEAAGRYVALVREADRMANLPNLSSEAIAQALVVTSQTSGRGISEGAGAYATQVAANNAEFASSLRTTVNLLGRDAVMERLKSNPDAFLAMIAGSRQASRSASGALAASEAKLARAAEVLGEAAYSVQTQNWSQRAVDTQATLAAHRQAANVPMAHVDAGEFGASAPSSDAPINGRYLVAASYQILGENGAATEVLDKPLGRMCMNRVQLNVRQCLAASQYPYEHLFCLSRRSFGETLGCVKDTVK